MNIVISNRTIENCGIDTYAKSLAKGMNQFADINVYEFEDRKLTGFSMQKGIYQKVIYFPRKLYRDQWLLPIYLKKVNADIFHCTECYGIPNNLSCKVILTLHDIIPARMNDSNEIKRYLWERKVKSAIKKADAIVTVSNFSKNDIADYFGIDPSNIYVIYEKADKEFSPNKNEDDFEWLKKKLGINKPYILLIGGKESRKNHKRVIDVYKKKFLNKYQLVILGEGYSSDLQNNEIILPGFVSRKELIILYSYTSVFVYPSLYEGFGLPVLEAMACGAPVVTSNTTSIPEVAGDAAILVNPTDRNEIAYAMSRVLDSDELREKLIYKGLQRKNIFSSEKELLSYYKLYIKMI